MTATRLEFSDDSDSRTSAPVEEAEAIVVGSGFGGAVAACRLAQAGLDVVLIERGRRYEARDFPALPNDAALLPDIARWTWQQSQGLWDIVDLEEMLSVQAAGYGGGSLIYANVHLRPPPAVFDERWPEPYRGGESLQAYYDLAASMLDVAPIDAHGALADALIKPDQLRKVARHLGREDAFFHPPLAISYREGANAHGRQQNRCTGCGACCTGCPETAKNTLDFNYLAVAENHGARAVTQCEVVGINQRDDGKWTLSCVDHLAARRRTFRARYLFLCAGSVHSTRLLARARLGERGRAAQSMAGVGYFANADAVGMVYDTTHPQHPSFGPAITTSTVCWDSEDPREFFMVQDGGYPRELERLSGMLRAAAWVGRNRLTKPVPATVDPSHRPAPSPRVGPPARALALVSPLDDVLDAMAHGAFEGVTSPGARNDWATFLGELKDPLLLPAIVDRTIDVSMADWLSASRLMSWLPGWAKRSIMRVNRLLIRKIYGTNEVLADRALRAILGGANLGRDEIARRVLGYDGGQAAHRVMLLAMGRDAVPGVLHYDRRRDRMIADLDLYHLVPRYTNEERVMSEMASALGGELRTNPAWAFMGKPISVHNQGGCPMSTKPEDGVTTPDGQVHGGSILCTSVGVNPSATITAIAERNILHFIRRYKANDTWPENDSSDGALEYRRHQDGARAWAAAADNKGWALRPPAAADVPFQPESEPLGLAFREVMQGYYAPTAEVPVSDERYRGLETKGRPAFPMTLTLDVSVANLARLFEDCHHQMQLSGSVSVRLPDEEDEHSYPAQGQLDLFIKRHKPYGIRADEPMRRSAQERLAGGRRYTTTVGEPERHEKREMTYALTFKDRRGREWAIEGHKSISDDPGVDAWRDTSSLFVSLLGPAADEEARSNGGARRPVCRGAGVVHVDMDGFLYHQLPSMRITPLGVDPARAMWARMKFGSFFFGTLQRIYLPEARSALEALFKLHPNNVRQEQPKVGDGHLPPDGAERRAAP
jgi:choline dehydrogenase-like flavoprotein